MRNVSNGNAPLTGLVTISMPNLGAAAIQRPAQPSTGRTANRPVDAIYLTGSADALRLAGRFREAISVLDKVIAAAPATVAAWFSRALANESSGALAEAEADYRRVTEIAPLAAPGFAGLASILAQTGRLDEARAHADRAAVLGPNDSATVIAQARCDSLAGNHAAAAHRLERLTTRSGLPPHDAVIAFRLLGDALDRLNECDRAFEAYTRANQRFLATYGSARGH